MSRFSARLREMQELLLALFRDATNTPISLCEIYRDNEGHAQVKLFPDHPFASGPCSNMLEAFYDDLTGLTLREETLICCKETRVCTLLVPIVKADGQVWALLLYGAKQVDDKEWAKLEESQAGGANAVRDEFIRLLAQNKSKAAHPVNELKDMFRQIVELLFRVADEESEQRHATMEIAQELRTRLSAVIGEAENLFTEVHSLSRAAQRREIGKLIHAAQALDSVTQTLLDDYEDYDYQPVLMPYLIAEALAVYESEARQAGLDFELQMHPSKINRQLVKVSRRHLQIALNQLIHNAVKYSFQDTAITIKGHVNEELGEYQLTIENSGYGVLREEIASDAIFQDGYQGKLVQGKVRKGAGKGLPYVRRVIDQHGGRMVFISDQIQGKGPDPKTNEIPFINRVLISLPLKDLD